MWRHLLRNVSVNVIKWIEIIYINLHQTAQAGMVASHCTYLKKKKMKHLWLQHQKASALKLITHEKKPASNQNKTNRNFWYASTSTTLFKSTDSWFQILLTEHTDSSHAIHLQQKFENQSNLNSVIWWPLTNRNSHSKVSTIDATQILTWPLVVAPTVSPSAIFGALSSHRCNTENVR